MTKYPKFNDCEGVLLDPDEEYFRFACCDCGLVHTMAVVPEGDGKIGVAFKREPRATAQLRRHEFGYLQQGRGKSYAMSRTSRTVRKAARKVLKANDRSKTAKTLRGKGLAQDG